MNKFNRLSQARIYYKDWIKRFLIEDKIISSNPDIPNNDDEEDIPRNVVPEFFLMIAVKL